MKKKIDVHMFFFLFLRSDIPGLLLGILKMLIRVSFCDVLQPALYQFFLSMYNSQLVCIVFAVNICYLQVLAMSKKVLS